MLPELRYPFDPHVLLMEKRRLRRLLAGQTPVLTKKIAILGGSTTAEVRDMIELFMLAGGIAVEFYESDYNQFYEDAVFRTDRLAAFAPDLIYIHTTVRNINGFPEPTDADDVVTAKLEAEYGRFERIWESLQERLACPVIQNNFELPLLRHFGNFDAAAPAGRTNFVNRLNLRVAEYARRKANLHVCDINHLSARIGLNEWFDDSAWFAYKYALSIAAIPHLAHNFVALAQSIFGRAKKCLVLDLDNTLWGGVIGDDGVDGIQLGPETAVGEAHQALQRYVKKLGSRGVILAVCSKNEPETALSGFSHRDTVLAGGDFASFTANWEPKHLNIAQAARTLNIGLDSMVFVDDNPAEREIVTAHLPQVLVLPLAEDISGYPRAIDQSGAFEAVELSAEDASRAGYYAGNSAREALRGTFGDYQDYLRDLMMRAVIGPCGPAELGRVTQLINKTNQFNLTTLRMSEGEVAEAAADSNRIVLFGRLSDKFGDNGLVSVVIGTLKSRELHIDLWVMSCRVLKRDMEMAMFEALCRRAREAGAIAVIGYFRPSGKNAIVAEHYAGLGFRRVESSPGGDTWKLEIDSSAKPTNDVIDVTYAQ